MVPTLPWTLFSRVSFRPFDAALLSCRVYWDEETGEYACPCHAAFFDQYGAVKSGPPPRPLDQYEIKIEDNQLFIHLTDG